MEDIIFEIGSERFKGWVIPRHPSSNHQNFIILIKLTKSVPGLSPMDLPSAITITIPLRTYAPDEIVGLLGQKLKKGLERHLNSQNRQQERKVKLILNS